MIFVCLLLLLFVLLWMGADFSPSYTTLLLAVALYLLIPGRFLPGEGRCIKGLKELLMVLGAACLFPSILVYTAQSDVFKTALYGAVILSALGHGILWLGRRHKGKRCGGSLHAPLLGAAALTCLFSAYESRALLPCGLGLMGICLSLELEKEKIVRVLCLLGLSGCVLFQCLPFFAGTSLTGVWQSLPAFDTPFAYLFTGDREALYVNRDKTMTGEEEAILPGALWLDTEGNPIQAHGGQITRMPVPDEKGEKEMLYVWVGEDKRNGHFSNPAAVYTSEDFRNWTFRGDILRSVSAREELDTDPYFQDLYGTCTEAEKDYIYDCIGPGRVMERPKMLYNEKTDRYVLWFHNDGPTQKSAHPYDRGFSGVAVSDSPFGPFRFLYSRHLSLCPKGQIDCFPLSRGEARDMNLFQDDDGQAYVIYTSENNKTLYISRLNEAYTDLSADPEEAVYGEDYIRLFPGSMREAPVLFKGENGRYYIMSSSTTGWASNGARVWSAEDLFGSWRTEGNPFTGTGRNIACDTQCTSIFQSLQGDWIYYGDRWKPGELWDSRYVWLPLSFEGSRVRIQWAEAWTLGG